MFRFFFANSTAPVSRLPWIDYAKGIAIILVVYRHTMIGMYRAGVYVHEYYVVANKMVYNFRMPLFFIIAGFLIQKSLAKRSAAQFIWSKFDHILYPYLIWGSLQITLQIVLDNYATSSRSFLDYLYLLYHPRAIDQYWYLYALFNVSVLYLFMFRFFKGNKLALLGVSFVMHLLTPYLKDISLLHDICFYFMYVVIGDSVSEFALRESNQRLFSSTKLSVLIIPVFILCQWLWFNYDLGIFANIIVTLVGCALMFNICFKLQQSNLLLWLRYIGYYSLYIYVMHVIMGAGVRIFLISVLGLSNATLIFILATSCGVIIPIMIYNAAMRSGLWFLFSISRPKRLAITN
jgi:fucose 4-O-acetylase-like acetyltransferase